MHFTYEEKARPDLHQGDLIKRTEEINHILAEIHPHYFKSETYTYFIILTQSCDLVRRSGNCKARYITIAAVRPAKFAIQREISKYQNHDVERQLGICSQEHESRVSQFVERLLNNNEAGYFFLAREPEAEFPEDQCAFLHLSIPIRADLHYETLLRSRCLQLSEVFQHKLGFLVGNLYSRIGTADWTDHYDKQVFVEKRQNFIRNDDVIAWIQKPIYAKLIKKLEAIPKPSESDLEAAIAELVALSEKERQLPITNLLKALEDTLLAADIPPEIASQIKRRFSNRAELGAVLKSKG